MSDLILRIRSCEDHWRELFAVSLQFNERMVRWNNESMSDQYTTNAFCSDVELTLADVQAAYDEQQSRGLHFLQLMCRKPLSAEIAERFSLREELVLTMAYDGCAEVWNSHPNLLIKDVQQDDIADAIIAFHLKQEAEALKKSDYAKRQILQDLAAAKKHPEYHWLAAYLDGEMVGLCHVLCHANCVEIDDLVVDEAARKQYVATTILKYIVENFEGSKYLHADAEGSSRTIYENLGFVIIDRCWEYRNTKLK